MLPRAVSKLSQIVVQILDDKRSLCVFSPLWGLGATYTVHIWLTGKLAMDFLFVLINLFSLGVWIAIRVVHYEPQRICPSSDNSWRQDIPRTVSRSRQSQQHSAGQYSIALNDCPAADSLCVAQCTPERRQVDLGEWPSWASPCCWYTEHGGNNLVRHAAHSRRRYCLCIASLSASHTRQLRRRVATVCEPNPQQQKARRSRTPFVDAAVTPFRPTWWKQSLTVAVVVRTRGDKIWRRIKSTQRFIGTPSSSRWRS